MSGTAVMVSERAQQQGDTPSGDGSFHALRHQALVVRVSSHLRLTVDLSAFGPPNWIFLTQSNRAN